MVGLPESTRNDELNTAKDLIKLKPKIIRIYPVLVIKGTKLEEEYLSGEYSPLTVEQAVEISKELLVLFNSKKINVIRIGLQNTNEITDPDNSGSQVVAGPFHPAFRQLVESRLWYDTISNKIKNINSTVKDIQIDANPYDVNNVVGHKRMNIEKIDETYDTNLIVKVDSKVKKGKIKITSY